MTAIVVCMLNLHKPTYCWPLVMYFPAQNVCLYGNKRTGQKKYMMNWAILNFNTAATTANEKNVINGFLYKYLSKNIKNPYFTILS